MIYGSIFVARWVADGHVCTHVVKTRQIISSRRKSNRHFVATKYYDAGHRRENIIIQLAGFVERVGSEIEKRYFV